MTIKKSTLKKFLYHWSGTEASGKKISGEISAISRNHASMHLKQQGITLTKIHRERKIIFKNSHKKISSVDVVIFFRQLATLISAGIPLTESCTILGKNSEKPALQKLINTLVTELAMGKTLQQIMKKYPKYFDELTVNLISTGEQSGTLDIILHQIADHKEYAALLKNKIKQAFFYPIVVVAIAMLLCLVMLIFVVPQFEELFQTCHNQLPFFTRMVIAISHFIRQQYFYLLAAIFFIGNVIFYLKKNIPPTYYQQRLGIKFPIIRRVASKIIFTRWTRCLALTFKAGIPITDALKMAASTCNNLSFAKAIQQVQITVANGQSLHSAMQNQKIFPPLMVQMIKVGEESGTLGKMLEKITELYEADIHKLITILTQLLEPLIMVILGVLIGGLVIAMYLPIFKLGTLM